MKKEIQLISNFNIENLFNLIDNQIDKKQYYLAKPTYGLFQDNAFKLLKSKNTKHLCIVWTQIEKILKSFDNLIHYNYKNVDKLAKETDEYINIIKQISKKTQFLIVFSWVLPKNERGKFLNDFTDKSGLTRNLNFVNNKISEELKNYKNIFFLNSDFIIKDNNYDFNPKYWYLAKIPYSQKVFETASEEIIKIINTINGKYIKLIVLDLDNTIWGGILGDLGWENITLGGHSATGEAFQDFQKKLKALSNLGIQLAISSKNDEKIALEAINKNKNMILKEKDFVTWKINWSDKAKNIQEIIKELNLTNDNVLFLDDNISERERVKRSLKGINVPDLPKDPCLYIETLLNLGCFEYGKELTKEDLNRSNYYKENKKRDKFKETFISEDEWIKSLNTKVIFNKINKENTKRILQLINRTNQMNLTTRRMSDKDLEKLKKKKNNHLYCCEVKDKFGDMGIVGFFNLELNKGKAFIRDFILSCRAFGREIEKGMLFKISQLLKNNKINFLELNYIKTKKNKPCYTFLKNNFKETKKYNFIYKDTKTIKIPKNLTIK